MGAFITLLAFIVLIALVISIVAARRARDCDHAMWTLGRRVDKLEDRIAALQQSFRESARSLSEAAAERPPPVEAEAEIPVAERAEPPPEPVEEEIREVAVTPVKEEGLAAAAPEAPETPSPAMPRKQPPTERAKAFVAAIDKEWWRDLERQVGQKWMTWVGAVVLFLSVGFFVKYAFEHEWLGPMGRVILGVIAGLGVCAAGERLVTRGMRPLGQGLVGCGLAMLYVSFYAAYGFYDELLPREIVFVLMALVTTGGVVLAIVHDAIPISFIAVLGGLITPALLSTGEDPRDTLFAYLLLLDIGVLGVAFFKRWRALDLIAFFSTWGYFTWWHHTHYGTAAMVPATLWLYAFFLLFFATPFVYHLYRLTPITGERFFLAVSNAVAAFGFAYAILYETHKHVLGLVTLGMSASYLVLGSLTRKRIKNDSRAVLGFVALSVMFLMIAIPIHLDFHGVTVAWAVQGPVLLYLAYKYTYFPVRVGSLIPLALATGTIFTTNWPLHTEAFTPIFNREFGSAIFVALAGAACTVVHYLHRKNFRRIDRLLMIGTGIASAFLALIVMHIEMWQWLSLSGRGESVRWASALVWVAGSAGFLAAGTKLRSVHTRASGLAALVVVAFLVTWDYALGMRADYLLFLNGRFLAALASILVVFSYGSVYRRSQAICRLEEKRLTAPFFCVGILALTLLGSVETWLYLALLDRHYMARCLLPVFWVAGTAGCLFTGIRLRSYALRTAGLVTAAVAAILASVGYGFKMEPGYILYVNGRFLAGLAVILSVFGYGFVLRSLSDIFPSREQRIAKTLYWIGLWSLFTILSVETPLYFRNAITGFERARWASQMSLSIVWAVYAAAMLTVGFRWKVRSLRLCALGLFGLTALKLVIVDMAKVKEVYRIASFLVLGILMIGASYAYHRVEKALATSSREER